MAATLIIGIGGQGGKIVERIARRVSDVNAEDVEFVVMDTDVNDLERLHRSNARIATVQTSYRSTVGGALDANREAREGWFPVTPGLLGKSLTEGAGQVRAISRLAFDHAVESGEMRPLEKAIENLRALRGDRYEQSLRVMICGCLSGGTGSGIALPVAMYVRNFLLTRYQDQSTIIRGFFLEPDCLFSVITDEEERNNQRCNAYAAIREIDAFMRKQYTQETADEYRHVVFNAPQPGLGRRMDYPNILPYNYVFLMDAMNLDGEHLSSVDSYLDHIADIIFTQSVGTAAARSNSTEDNFTRRLDQSQGRARYCGAGCSHLTYPYEIIRSYFGLRWSVESISAEWMELDRRFRKELKEHEVEDTFLDRALSYRRNFDVLRGQNKFFSRLGKDAKIVTSRRDNTGVMVETEASIGDTYARRLEEYAGSWNENGLVSNCGALDAWETTSRAIRLPNSQESVRNFADARGAGWTSALDIEQERFGEQNGRYYNLVANEVSSTAGLFARRTFSTNDLDGNPLEMLNDSQYIESYLSKEDGRGAKHPIVVRYILADAIVALSERLEELTKERDGQLEALGNLYESMKKYEEGETTGSESKGGGGLLQSAAKVVNDLQGKATVTDEEADEYASKSITLMGRRRTIDAFRRLVVQCEFVEAALEHVREVSDAYMGFFSYMNAKIPQLEEDARAIESDPALNVHRYSPTRYVCANKECLTRLYEECPKSGSSSELPSELCADIYRGILRYTSLMADAQTYEQRNAVGKSAFEDLFQRTVVDFWTMRLEHPEHGSNLANKSVLQAVVDEMRYSERYRNADPSEWSDLLRGHLLDVIDEAYDLALPYIMKPLEPEGEEKPSNARFCLYSDDVLEDLGEFKNDAANSLRALGGVEVKNGEVTSHEVLFFRQIYGFRAAHLPHYSCAHEGNESRPAGEYHNAYWDIANQLSPDTKRNRYITPHIDRHWHLISYLPDISDDYQRELYEQIIRAYLYGLTNREFGSTTGGDRKSSFHLRTDYRQKQISLMSEDGGRCDKFHEVFDALKYDPQVVVELIRRSDASLERETSRKQPPEDSLLVSNINSVAFEPHEGPDQVLASIDAFMGNEAALSGDLSFTEAQRMQFFSRMVSDFFGFDTDSRVPLERVRHSIFEIPVFYYISLPPTDVRSGEIEDMLDGIYATVHNYFINFTSKEGLDYVCTKFLEEQYLRFELNLPLIEAAFPDTAGSSTVSAIRERVPSFFDRTSDTGRVLYEASRKFASKWTRVREAKEALEVRRQAEAFASTK